MMKLRRLKIIEFLHTIGPVELGFSDTVTFLLGKNGTGKTTLLSLLAALVRHDFAEISRLGGAGPIRFEASFTSSPSPFTTGGFSDAGGTYLLDFDVSLEARRPVPTELPPGVSAGLSSEDRQGFVRLSVRRKEDGLSAQVTVRHDGALDTDPLARKTERFPRPTDPHLLLRTAVAMISSFSEEDLATDQSGPSRIHERKLLLLRAWSRSSIESGRFDEALGAFDRLTSGRSDAPHAALPPPATIERSGGGASLSLVPAGDFFLNNPVSGSAWSGAIPSSAPVCRAIAAVLGAHAVDARARALQVRPGEGEEDQSARYEGFDFRITWPGGQEDHHSLLSFGQKRALFFAWHLACIPDGVVVADELSNGLHYDMLLACLDLIGKRQTIVALQNPLMLDMVGLGERATIQDSLILCATEGTDGRLRRSWRNATAEEAERISVATDASLDRLSSILRQHGLW
jgi:energy-coupling factor transporter ATP-binding protein EcfA2